MILFVYIQECVKIKILYMKLFNLLYNNLLYTTVYIINQAVYTSYTDIPRLCL